MDALIICHFDRGSSLPCSRRMKDDVCFILVAFNLCCGRVKKRIFLSNVCQFMVSLANQRILGWCLLWIYTLSLW